MIIDEIGLHSVLLPLLIILVFMDRDEKLFLSPAYSLYWLAGDITEPLTFHKGYRT